MTVTEARKRWGAVFKAAQREPVLIRRRGHDVCVFVSAGEYMRIYGVTSLKAKRGKLARNMKNSRKSR